MSRPQPQITCRDFYFQLVITAALHNLQIIHVCINIYSLELRLEQGFFSGRGCAVGGETRVSQMQHMLTEHGNVRARERQQHESAEGMNVTGLRPEGTAFPGRPCEVGAGGRGMREAGLSMCFIGRAGSLVLCGGGSRGNDFTVKNGARRFSRMSFGKLEESLVCSGAAGQF